MSNQNLGFTMLLPKHARNMSGVMYGKPPNCPFCYVTPDEMLLFVGSNENLCKFAIRIVVADKPQNADLWQS